MPLDAWADANAGEPWASFASAATLASAGDRHAARQSLAAILARPELESRHYLQAWHGLRAFGDSPPPHEATHLYGVVVEVTMKRGSDVLAAYEDRTARYLNFSGAAVIWDRPASPINELIDRLLDASRSVVARIGPWEGARPGLPPQGEARLNFLTPRGLCFGQAPLNALATDALAGPVVVAATALMQALTQRATAS